MADGDPGRECTITTLIIGLPRQVVVQRCRRADVHLVLRDDGAVWPPLAVAQWRTGRATLAPGRPGLRSRGLAHRERTGSAVCAFS